MKTRTHYTQRQLDAQIRDSLTAYIVACAAQYSLGAWDGTGIAEDMLKGARIKPREIRKHEPDPIRRKRLVALLKNSP